MGVFNIPLAKNGSKGNYSFCHPGASPQRGHRATGDQSHAREVPLGTLASSSLTLQNTAQEQETRPKCEAHGFAEDKSGIYL